FPRIAMVALVMALILIILYAVSSRLYSLYSVSSPFTCRSPIGLRCILLLCVLLFHHRFFCHLSFPSAYSMDLFSLLLFFAFSSRFMNVVCLCCLLSGSPRRPGLVSRSSFTPISIAAFCLT